jgi:hypothetical protein
MEGVRAQNIQTIGISMLFEMFGDCGVRLEKTRQHFLQQENLFVKNKEKK